MKNILAKQTIWSYLLLAASILLIPGFIIFMINSTTGYLYGSNLSILVVILSIVGILGGIALALFGDKLGRFAGIGYVLVAACAAISIAGIAWSVEAVVGDIYFIPVNHPEAEDTTWTLAIATLVFYALSFVAATAACFGGKLYKEAPAQ